MSVTVKIHIVHILITSVIMAFLCPGCLEPISLPDVSSGYLVVEARFTNDPGVNQVILLFAGNVNEDSNPVTEASVYITDDLGVTGWFEETEDGKYLPQNHDFPGIAGRKYVLNIELAGGRHYQSDTCLLLDVPPIKDFCWDLKQAPSPDHTRWIHGLEFRIDTYDPVNLPRYFMWTYDEIWETHVPHPVLDIYKGNGRFEAVENPIRRCFIYNENAHIRLQSTGDQSETILRNFPIAFISNESKRLWMKYRIKVYQYNLSDEAYFYHEQLQESTDGTGSIFDKQPSTHKGNIRNKENPLEMVMGYFTVSGVSTRSITIDPQQDLPREYWGKNPEFEECVGSLRYERTSSYWGWDYIFNRALRGGYALVSRNWYYPPTGEPVMIGIIVAPLECTTCNGSVEIPEDWD
jgi:hypothetical protein